MVWCARCYMGEMQRIVNDEDRLRVKRECAICHGDREPALNDKSVCDECVKRKCAPTTCEQCLRPTHPEWFSPTLSPGEQVVKLCILHGREWTPRGATIFLLEATAPDHFRDALSTCKVSLRHPWCQAHDFARNRYYDDDGENVDDDDTVDVEEGYTLVRRR